MPSVSLPVRDVPPALQRLPLLTLYLTERCNSRCVSCDYWRHGRAELSLPQVQSLLPALERLKTRQVLLSGGEPLMNRDWAAIATLLKQAGLSVWLLTSGLALTKHVPRLGALIDALTVSLDGTDAATYEAIRGLDAFERVCAGIRSAAAAGLRPGLRVTLQRRNYRQLPEFVELASRLGACGVSFLAVDVGNPHAFGRLGAPAADLALTLQEVEEFQVLVSTLEQRYAPALRSGFIAQSAAKLRQIGQYFAALHGQAAYPPVRCNAPEFSAVLTAQGRLDPCFFIAGAADNALPDLAGALNVSSARTLRQQISGGSRPECQRCVCSMWRQAS